MARNLMGCTTADVAVSASNGAVQPGSGPWPVYTTGPYRDTSVAITDLTDMDGTPITQVTFGADGVLRYFSPDGDTRTHWLDVGQGLRIAVRPVSIVGNTGLTPDLSIGTVTTGTAAATLTGTTDEPVLNLVLPAGPPGAIPEGAVLSAAATDNTDQTAVLQAELNSLQASGGGTLVLPRGTIRIDGVITIPNNGVTPVPRQAPLRIVGQGEHSPVRSSTPLTGSGTVLDIKGTDTYGKIKSNGMGVLELSRVTLRDTSGGSTPFVYTTNTTLRIYDCAFLGSKTTSSCNQDAIVCGGTQHVEGSAGWDEGFQGYGSIIAGNFFGGIRRAVYGRVYFNANVIRDNTVWITCGSNLSDGAAFELDGVAPASAVGNVFTGNLIEMLGYKHAFKFVAADQNTVAFNNLYDHAPGYSISGVLFTDTARNNMVWEGFRIGSLPAVTDQGSGTGNSVWMIGGNQRSLIDTPAKFTNSQYPVEFVAAKSTGLASSNTTMPLLDLQPTFADTPETKSVIRALRSATAPTNPGTIIFSLLQRGDVVIGGALAGSVTFQDAAGTVLGGFSTLGSRWSQAGAGRNVRIDTGNPGGNLDVWSGAGLRVFDAGGTVQRVKIGGGADQVVLGPDASNQAIVKRAAHGITDVGKLAVGNAAAATTPGSVVKKIEVFDAAGASLGFVPVYSSIT